MKPLRFNKGAIHALILLAIIMAAGPEYFAALEMATLLELLGAALFLAAYSAGVRLLLREIVIAFVDLLLPPAQRTLLRARVPRAAKCEAVGFLVKNAVVSLVMLCVLGVFICRLPAMLM